MKEQLSATLGRRQLLRAMMVGVVAAAAVTATAPGATVTEPKTAADKRRIRYQPNSAEVQEFYRVNRYPRR